MSLESRLMHKKGLCGGDRYTMIFSRDSTHPLHGLAQEFLSERPGARVQVERRLVDDETDLSCADALAAQVPFVAKSDSVKLYLRLLPEQVLECLLEDSVSMRMGDGSGSHYDARTRSMELKGTPDLFHEIGHHYFNYVIVPSSEEREGGIAREAMSEDMRERRPVPDSDLPSTHREYARLIGAYSAQFVQDPSTTDNIYYNDVDEHFARNFDRLVRGRPLEVMETSKACVDDLLDFYQERGIIDEEFKEWYLFNTSSMYGADSLVKHRGVDGIRYAQGMSMTEVADIQVSKRLRTEEPISLEGEVAIRLDLTEEFASFALATDARKVCAALDLLRTGSDSFKELLLSSHPAT